MTGQSLIGNLAVDLLMETAAFEQGATYAEKRLNKMSRSFEKIGQGWIDLGQKMTLGLTVPIAAFGATAIKAAAESKDALGQVEAALTSMGDASGRTLGQLQDLAGGQMRKSLFDDDEILRKVTANLLTFGNVSGKQFDRAQQAALDLATRLQMDLQSATLLVGKALNDPVKGMNAMKRAGIQFTDQQKAQVEAMLAVNNVAGAQAIMLGELERQFGGAAAAARKADPFGALKISFGELQETIGGKLTPVLVPLVDKLTVLIDKFSALPPGAQTTAIALAGIAAIAGPVLMGLGAIVQALAPFIAAISFVAAEGGPLLAFKAAMTGLGIVWGPVLLGVAAFAAAGAVIYANWDKIAPVLSEFWEALKQAIGPEVIKLIETLKATLSDLWNGPLGAMLREGVSLLGDFAVAYIKAFGLPTIAAIKLLASGLVNLFQMIGDGVRAVKAVFDGDWKGAILGAVSVFNRLFGGLPAYVAGIGQRIGEAIRVWVVDKLNSIWTSVEKRIEQVKQSFFGLYDAVVGHSYVPDMVDGIAEQMKRLDAVMVDPANKATAKTGAAFRKLADEVKPLLDRLFPEAAALNGFRSDNALINKAEKGKALTADQAAEARKRLALEGQPNTIEDWMAEWSAPIDVSGDIEVALSKILKATGQAAQGLSDKTVQIAKSFKDMASETLDSLNGLASAIKGGGFLDIFSSVLDLLLQLGSFGLFGSKIATNLNSAKGFGGFRANGGPVVPGKSYIVGENGPEWFTAGSAGGIRPMSGGGGAVVQIVPTPYFDAIVDGRAARVAAPMAAASGHFARQAAGGDMQRQARRRIPG